MGPAILWLHEKALHNGLSCLNKKWTTEAGIEIFGAGSVLGDIAQQIGRDIWGGIQTL